MHHPSQLSQIYRAFLAVVLGKDIDSAATYVTQEFRAHLSQIEGDLDLETLVREVARQREVFPDLGQNIITPFGEPIVDTAQRSLVYTYSMSVTFSGTLHGHQGDGRTLDIVQQDRVAFDESGKIARLEIVSDMWDTLAKIF